MIQVPKHLLQSNKFQFISTISQQASPLLTGLAEPVNLENFERSLVVRWILETCQIFFAAFYPIATATKSKDSISVMMVRFIVL